MNSVTRGNSRGYQALCVSNGQVLEFLSCSDTRGDGVGRLRSWV